MKIISAVDSFKGSVSSSDINNCVEKGIRKVYPNSEVIKVPIADGGEGTVESLIEALGGEIISLSVRNPLGEMIDSYYGILYDKKTAVIEMALASGLPLIPEEKRNPMKVSSYGTGELIKDALDRGCTEFIVGIGGSATNDGGIGMLEALGYKFYDKNLNYLETCGENLINLKIIDDKSVNDKLKNAKFLVACDVNNPFYGENGAAHVYGRQKGATENMILELDKGLENFANLIKNIKNIDVQTINGTGAAGGIGGAFVSFLNAKLESGIDIILKKLNFEEIIKDADLVITGEGKIDFQTSMGKTPVGIARIAKKYNIPVIAIAGSVADDAEEVHKNGIDAYFSIMNYPISLNEAMKKENTKKFLIKNIEEIFRVLKIYYVNNH